MRKFIAIKECSSGNETVGEMHLETKIYSPPATLEEVWDWSREKSLGGRLIISLADNLNDEAN